MLNINKKDWVWFYIGFEVGDELSKSLTLNTLNFNLVEFKAVGKSDEQFCMYRVIDGQVTNVYTIKEAERLLKLKQL